MDVLDTQRVRAGRNQSLFREVNERIEELAADWEVPRTRGYVCECLDTECTQTVSLTRDEYERLRQQPDTFAVAPGHEYLDVEVVVEKSPRYVVVRKIGAAAQVAEAEDPRSE